MKVFHINIVANSRSTGRIVEGIVRLSEKKGIQSYVAYGRWANESRGVLYKIGSSLGICMHVLLTRLFDWHGLGSRFATKRMVRYIDRVKPEIIHLHNIHGYYLNYPILFEYLSRVNIPVVWTFHDCWAFTGHCAYYTACGCDKWKTGCFQCPNLKGYPTSIFNDSSKSNYQRKKIAFTSLKNLTIVPVSEWLASQVKGSFFNNYKIKTIHNGVDIQVFSPQCKSKKDFGWEGKFVILGVASAWSERKGLNDFIELSKHLGDDEQIVLVGLSEKQLSILPENIIGLRNTESVHELAQLYSVSDVYLNFSIEETFGMTTVESMSCGTPVIVVNSTASPELINEKVGFVVNSHDVSMVLGCINELKRQGKSKYSSDCRSHVLENFNELELFSEYVSLYEDIVNVGIR